MKPITSFEALAAKAAQKRELIAREQAELNEIETLLQLAEKWNVTSGPTQVTGPGALAALAQSTTDAEVARSLFGETKKAQIINCAAAVLSDGRRRLSRELLREMSGLGVHVGGKDPASNLSSYLSRETDKFESNIKLGGWTLKTARPDDVGASSGLYINATRSTHPQG